MEKVYRTMRNAGVASMVVGIIIAAVGMTLGTIAVINGAVLLKRKSEITF